MGIDPKYGNRFKGRFHKRRNERAIRVEKGEHATAWKEYFTTVRFPIPKLLYNKLKALSEELGTPMTRLILDLVFKEIMTDSDFKYYGFELPESIDENDVDTIEVSKRIYEFIESFERAGISVETAFHAMFDLNIHDLNLWTKAYKLLLDLGDVKEFETKLAFLKYTTTKVRVTSTKEKERIMAKRKEK